MEHNYPEKLSLKLVFEKKYGKVYISEEKKSMICVLTKDYVPIEKFKKIFNVMTTFVKEYGIERFVFDKRYLRAFHQPSMEWYFVEWKQELYEMGLSVHRKILPKGETWFKDAVDAGRARIIQKYPHIDLERLDIAYCETVEEALEK